MDVDIVSLWVYVPLYVLSAILLATIGVGYPVCSAHDNEQGGFIRFFCSEASFYIVVISILGVGVAAAYATYSFFNPKNADFDVIDEKSKLFYYRMTNSNSERKVIRVKSVTELKDPDKVRMRTETMLYFVDFYKYEDMDYVLSLFGKKPKVRRI